jgi:DNA-binding LacI/PurR family transcriptional regulator
MKQYQRLYSKIKELIINGELKPGDLLPTRTELIDRFGGSTRPMMRAVTELEKEGLIARLSPKKFIVADNEGSDSLEEAVGVIGFDGEFYHDFELQLVNRLYDRNIFSYSVTPLGNELNQDRCFHRFFQNKIQSLVMRDGIGTRMKTLESFYGEKFEQLILVFNPYNCWNIPHHGIYVDRAYPMYEGLKLLYESGHRKIIVASAGDPPGTVHPRDRFDTGIQRFVEEFSRDKSLKLEIVNHFDLTTGAIKPEKWASRLDPETDAIIGVFDYAVIYIQEWIKKYSAINFEKLTCIGRGNTSWSKVGPNQFASYDCRVDDLVEMTLEIINDKPSESVIRRIKPKLERAEMILKRN